MSKTTKELDRLNRRVDGIGTSLQLIVDLIDDLRRRPETALIIGTGEAPAHLVLESAVENEIVVSFDYTDLGGTASRRIVSPYRIIPTETGLHLQCFDHLRDHLRQFALGRIQNILPEVAYEFANPEADYEDVLSPAEQVAVLGDEIGVVA